MEHTGAAARPSRRERLLIIGVLLLGVLLRVLVHAQLAPGPALVQHRWEETDMAFFLGWAAVVAGGDLLTDRELHPRHAWHAAVARAWLRDHPEAVAALRAAAPDVAPERTLWNRWLGGRRLHQGPLYPYALACLPGPDDHRAETMLIIQQLLGALGVLLAWSVARRLFGAGAGLAAALLLALCGPLIGHELVLLRAAPVAILSLLLVHLALRARERRTSGPAFLLGLAGGLAALLKSSLLPLAPAFALVLACGRTTRRAALRQAAAVLLAAALAMLPAVIRNVAVGVDALALPGVGASAFAMWNAEDAPTGTSFHLTRHLPAVLGESGGRVPDAVRLTIATHENAGSWPALLTTRFLDVWRDYEMPNNVNQQAFMIQAPLLRWLPGFGVCAALGLVGLALAGRRARRTAPLLLVVLLHLATLVLFGTFARYRLPLLVVLLPFAGLAAASTASQLGRRRFVRGGLLLAAAAGLAMLMIARPVDGGYVLRYADHAAARLVHYGPRVTQAQRTGRQDEVVRLLREELASEPARLDDLGPGTRAAHAEERRIATLFADVRQQLANALSSRGHSAEADRLRTRARELLEACR